VDKVYCVYILTNQRNTVLYTGVTGDLGARVYQHREKLLPVFRIPLQRIQARLLRGGIRCVRGHCAGKTDQGRLTAEEDRADQRVQSGMAGSV
jgi:hypothetical protein